MWVNKKGISIDSFKHFPPWNYGIFLHCIRILSFSFLNLQAKKPRNYFITKLNGHIWRYFYNISTILLKLVKFIVQSTISSILLKDLLTSKPCRYNPIHLKNVLPSKSLLYIDLLFGLRMKMFDSRTNLLAIMWRPCSSTEVPILNHCA